MALLFLMVVVMMMLVTVLTMVFVVCVALTVLVCMMMFIHIWCVFLMQRYGMVSATGLQMSQVLWHSNKIAIFVIL